MSSDTYFQGTGNVGHVFLSYSRKDLNVMQRVRDSLRAQGITVWTDENLTPGTRSWKKAIEDALENANALVVLLSPDAKQSDWVREELNYAEAREVRIFPILIRGDKKPLFRSALSQRSGLIFELKPAIAMR